MKKREIYLDYAATTPTDPRVLEVMVDVERRGLGNPSSMHMKGKYARDIIEVSRSTVAQTLGAHPDEIIFTGSGTESDNLAIQGIARVHKTHGKHIISCVTEHPAVLETLMHLKERLGFEITLLEVDEHGCVTADQVMKAIREDTILVSIMYANNEIGTIHPIAEIGRALDKYRKEQKTIYPLFHSDACQALGALDMNVEKLHVDLLTINSSKIYGPKGVGALFVRRGVKITSIQFGGEQEKRLRPGTENTAGIAGFAKAVELSLECQKKEVKRLTKLRDYFIKHVLKQIPNARLNGHPKDRLPNNVNISFLGVEGEALLLYLDAQGIFASSGSACTSQKLDPSHVIMALGVPHIVAHGSLRFTLGRWTKKKDLKFVLEVLPEIVTLLRSMSPINVDKS
ncbi:cysteine desulfurase [Patescibacteria group bacterium]|nr:cysteine desulfurase [Patescibacteria group bacterium]